MGFRRIYLLFELHQLLFSYRHHAVLCWMVNTEPNYPPHRFRQHPHRSPPMNMVPLSEIKCAPFLSSSDSNRACIDKYGRLRSDDNIPVDELSSPSSSTIDNGDKGESYILGIAEEDDLPNISKLTIDAFGADAITLMSGGEFSPLERALLKPGVVAFNAYTNIVAYAEVLSGLRKRTMTRRRRASAAAATPHNTEDNNKGYLLDAPVMVEMAADNDVEGGGEGKDDTIADIAAQSSTILILARSGGDPNDIDIIATVELRLQPTDAKIPFSEPWFDLIERRAATLFGFENNDPPLLSLSSSSSSSKLKDDYQERNQLQPYLSNLCVSQNLRGRRIGRAMVRCVEAIARDSWGYSKMYLHVDLDNLAAFNLYKSEGYKDAGLRWNPFWAGKAAEIGYFVKKLEPIL